MLVITTLNWALEGTMFRTVAAPRNTRGVRWASIVMVSAILVIVYISIGGTQASSTNATLTVPCGASIQTAINAAHSGETILLAPCTYVQQLTIEKSVNIVGAGTGQTIIQSPTPLVPDAFGNPWTIELGNAATVTLSGFTLAVTLQCIQVSGLYPTTGVLGYAGGGIGVGGSAFLNLQSAVVTTSGPPEDGAPCVSGPGFMSYGTGVDFGLDYLTATPPPASQLVGFGTVSGVTISGFGYGGPGVAVGGEANSPAGSYALISHDQILTVGTTLPLATCPCAVGIGVGDGGHASSATIVDNTLTVVAPQTTDFPILINFGSYVDVAHNSITGGGWGDALTVEFSGSATITGNSFTESGTGPYYVGIYLDAAGAVTITDNSITMTSIEGYGIFLEFSTDVTIEFNSITGPAWGYGIVMFASSATIESNSVSQFHCVPAEAAPTTCGPDWAYQAQGIGIWDYADAGLGTTIANNLIFSNDIGLVLYEGCSGCVVNHNVFVNNQYYGLAGIDGAYTFSDDTVLGGEYGVAYVAYSANTAVTLSHVVIVSPSVAPFYYENDCLSLWGYSCTDTIVGT